MTQQEIFHNMTKEEWKVSNELNFVTDRYVVGRVYGVGSVLAREMEANQLAIVTAVNWWQNLMSKGINPESPETMRRVLKMLEDHLSKNIDVIPNGSLHREIKEALTASKLQP